MKKNFLLFRKKKSFTGAPPQHIAIVLDGNGRWAAKRGLPRTAGHAAGAENFRTIATYCRDIGVKYLTCYAFSTENWSRPADEVSAIWDLLRKYLEESLEKMERDRVKIRIMGDRTGMPDDIKQLLKQCDEKSEHIDGITLCICLNYGGRQEILHAARELAAECERGERSADSITVNDISAHIYSAGIPDPDLIIRPSGEVRLSNFLLWQCAYSEFYFTKTLWPDFKPSDIDDAIYDFAHRDRRFGGVKEKGKKC